MTMERAAIKRIVIAEDHAILRDGLAALIEKHPGYEVVGYAGDGIEAVRVVREKNPDLVIMDLTMPRMNGMEAIEEIRHQSPETRLLVLTVHKTEEYVYASLRAGADGYLLKESTHAELITAIDHIMKGEQYLSPGISETVIQGYLRTTEGDSTLTIWETLTTREKEVLKLIAEGYKNREIAEYCCISIKTVEKHRLSLMKKLDMHNAQALTAYAIERGLVVRE